MKGGLCFVKKLLAAIFDTKASYRPKLNKGYKNSMVEPTRKDVRESSSRENNLFACAFWVIDGSS
jgi:hypothetical protein